MSARHSDFSSRHLYLSLIAILLVIGTASAQWGAPTIDTLFNWSPATAKSTGPQSIAISEMGIIHIVWAVSRGGPTGGNWILYSNNRYGGHWGVPDTVNTAEQIAFSPVIAVSPEFHNPVIAFEANDELVVAIPSQTGWSHQVVATAEQFQCCPTISIDDLGIPHLAWIAEDNGEYRIAYYPVLWGADIQILEETMPGEFGLGAAPFITTSLDGIAHISYREGETETYHIMHIYNDTPYGTTWTQEMMITPNMFDYTSVIIEEEDYDLHLAIAGNDGFGFPGRVYYLFKPARGVWTEPYLVTGTQSAVSPTMALDGNGRPHILSMETSGNFYTGNILASEITVYPNWFTGTLAGNDYGNAWLAIGPTCYGEVLCHTGVNSGQYEIHHLESQFPLAEVPSIVISPDTLQFGSVSIGEHVSLLLSIANDGMATLVIDTVVLSMGFSTPLRPYPFQIEPGQSTNILITFTPTTVDHYEGVCEIDHNAPGRVTSVPLRGVGYANLPPSLFGRIMPADSSHDPWYDIPVVEFTWTRSVDPEGIPITYLLRVFDEDYIGFDETQTLTDTFGFVTIPLPVLDEIETFYWQVRATDGVDTIQAFNGTGVFFLTIEDADEIDPVLINNYSLTAYPNPFNPSAMIAFSLPHAESVTVAVFDITGRLVQMLAAGYVRAGKHTLAFNGSALPSGVYFARMETRDVAKTYKLLLMK